MAAVPPPGKTGSSGKEGRVVIPPFPVLEPFPQQRQQQLRFCLYGALSLNDQRKAILPAPQGMRKVVLATNIEIGRAHV